MTSEGEGAAWRGPDFFFVGAAKSGTTALAAALARHPEVFLPGVKEPHYYAYLADPSSAARVYADEPAARARYRELYADVGGEVAVGDASTTNLVVPGAARAIAADVPGARIVAVLRHPVDRAFSHFRHFRAAGGEPLADFAQAVRQEDERAAGGWPFTYRYLGWGRYAGQLAPYFELFGRDRVLVHLYDEFCLDPDAVLRSTLRFLGVDDSDPLPAVRREGVIEAPRDRPRRRLRRPTGRRRPVPPVLDPELRARLVEGELAVEIDRLEELLDRDLSAWRS